MRYEDTVIAAGLMDRVFGSGWSIALNVVLLALIAAAVWRGWLRPTLRDGEERLRREAEASGMVVRGWGVDEKEDDHAR